MHKNFFKNEIKKKNNNNEVPFIVMSISNFLGGFEFVITPIQ